MAYGPIITVVAGAVLKIQTCSSESLKLNTPTVAVQLNS
jgi:hypothetical protein